MTRINGEKAERAISIYEKAARDLGPDLSGWSLVDLLLDNMNDLTFDEAQYIAGEIKTGRPYLK